MELGSVIEGMIRYARSRLGLEDRDVMYVRNCVYGLIGLPVSPCAADDPVPDTPDALVSAMADALIAAGAECDPVKTADAVMGMLSLPPHRLDLMFRQTMADSGAKAATDMLYKYCVDNSYVKKSVLDKNPRFDADGLVVTINKAKPEFRDAKAAAAKNVSASGYPRCVICRENEGYIPAGKGTLRTVSLELGGERYFWQYSPFGYFREHGIAVNCEHTPMRVDRGTLVKLLDFVDIFPHYFIGCNAALPRIGGSILAHDHFQGGGELLPLHRATAAIKLRAKGHADVRVSVLDWAGTAVRLSGKNRDALVTLGDAIRVAWEGYTDVRAGLIPVDADGVHHAVSPTVIKTADGYDMNLILRSNITSSEYPDGVFHAHPEFHCIKKESIGLIEAQGLFILPGRLERELGEIGAAITSGAPLPEEYASFGLVYDEIKSMCGSASEAEVRAATVKELGSVCRRILDNTAVFKKKQETAAFLEGLGFAIV